MTDQTVIRQVTEGIWTFSKPFARVGIWPIGGRSTAVKLTNGDVWVLASTPLTDATRLKLDELGEVKYLIAPDVEHHLYLADFKKAYPQAKVIGVEPLVEKKKGVIVFDGVYGKDAPGTKYGFEEEIDACYFTGHLNKDVLFCHKPSRTLIEADLLFNLPAKEQYSRAGGVGILGSIPLNPFSYLHKPFAWAIASDKEAMRRDAKTVAGWDFDRIIPCHGDVIEKEGNKAWREAYKWYFD